MNKAKVRTGNLSTGFRPLSYDRVRKSVLEMIQGHNLQPGDKLPSDRDLAKTFGLNHRTIRKAMAVLVAENIIDRRVGAGTFVVNVPEDGVGEMPGSIRQRFIRRNPMDRTKTQVGVLCPSHLDSFATEFLHHIHQRGIQREMNLVLRVIGDFDGSAREMAGELTEQGCQALLIPWIPQPEPVNEIWRLVQSSRIPVVLARPFPGMEANCSFTMEQFGEDDYAVLETLCRYFLKLGYSRVAFFGPDSQKMDGLSTRLLAYSRFVSNHGLESHVGLTGPAPEPVDRIVERWAKFAGTLAVTCFDDDHAIRLMTALHKRGLKIPDDVAVFGYNNIPLSANLDPPLSTVQYDFDSSVDNLLDDVQRQLGRPVPLPEQKWKKTLVIRESCGGKRRGGETLGAILRECRAMADPLVAIRFVLWPTGGVEGETT